ncbi:MAG TPA: proteasome subunit alpha [Stackebrandtia sp.]|jgi:proteasome alpha subunit|nr:proteasome subunit alpha [Stackebrandtia sp.]HZE38275.1 proteasome subunit alpha [Stackebrandtia sp.]
MQFYTSPEQIMRDRSEYARKNISRGRNTVVLSYVGGVIFVAENISSTLHKISELYDRIGFAAVGRYNEFENLRTAGVRMADTRGFAYDRRDVKAKPLAQAYAQTLGAIFTEQTKPFEVEICVAGVAERPEDDELYRCTYDGSINDEPGYLVMGGQADRLSTVLKDGHHFDASLAEAFQLALKALNSIGGDNGKQRSLGPELLEVAVLDREREGRVFRRISGAALEALLPEPEAADEPADDSDDAEESATED